MAIKGYCGIKACCDCSRGCKLDASIPCSPDCENLTHDGKILLEKCLQEKCEEVKYIFNMPDSSDEELLTKYGAVTQYPYLHGGVSVKSWDEIEKKYPQDRENMTEEMERNFVEDCFSCYEAEGFSQVFWSPFSGHEERFGEAFEVIGRCSESDKFDLCVLPMWNIRFQDGTIVAAYPEEIIPSQMRRNGCNLKKI